MKEKRENKKENSSFDYYCDSVPWKNKIKYIIKGKISQRY